MSHILRLCGSCRRHVRYSETACPFCSVPLVAATPPRLPDLSRLSRAAQIAVGAALLASCGGDPKPEPVTGPPPTEDAGVSGPGPGDVTAMYGAPAPPPEEQPNQQQTPQNPPPPDPGPARPLYGMPPPK